MSAGGPYAPSGPPTGDGPAPLRATLPRAARPFVEFPTILRAHGFAVAPDQTVGFIEAIGLLGPRDIEDIRRAGLAMLAVPHDREAEYDALFRAFFLGQTVEGVSEGEDDEVAAHEATGEAEVAERPDDDEAGEDAATAERLSRRDFAPEDPEAALARLSREARKRLPRRRSYRHAPDRKGRMLDMRRTLREAARRGVEVFTLAHRRRKTRQRRIVLLIDVSGSMKDRSEGALRFAHTLTHAAERIEAFTLGTRLTRVSPALRIRSEAQALDRISGIVADFDGGTRIGEALTAFLAVPRFAGYARGAAVIVLSDGLERGGPELLKEAARRLSRIAWRFDWLTPLAADPDFEPTTSALSAILPTLDALENGATVEALTDHVLALARAT